MQRVTLEPLFILHSRPFRDTSLIIDCLTAQHGRISLVARSARGIKSRYKGMLQLFSPLLASWSGDRELKNLNTVELHGPIYHLKGIALISGFYVNELLQRLLQREDPHPEIHTLYQSTLHSLENTDDPRRALRCFEKNLLMALGYGLSLQVDAQSREDIRAADYYQFIPERGFLACESNPENHFVFLGKTLFALFHESFDEESLRESQRLLRLVLHHYLGGRPIKSRELLF